MKSIGTLAAAGLLLIVLSGCGRPAWEPGWLRSGRGFIHLPGGTFTMGSREAGPDAPPREVAVGPFRIARHEVTVKAFVKYLNDQGETTRAETPQIALRNGRLAPRGGKSREPVAHISFDEAEAYCRWLSSERGCRARLPTEAEWEYAARGGIRRSRYPWGWGDPAGRARFGASGACGVGSFPPNPFGLFDMAGNVFEWCLPDEDAPPNTAPARGGSWAERDPRLLCVYHRAWFPRDYRDADVGFRIVVEEEVSGVSVQVSGKKREDKNRARTEGP